MTRANIEPAKRIEKVEEYYFSSKLREIREMSRQGIEVINLGIGSPDLPPSQEVIDTLMDQAYLPGNHGYQPYTGIQELRDAFAGWYLKHYGVKLDPASEILPLMGSKEGIMHISMAFINQGDKVLVPNPGYPAYRSASALAGAETVDYQLMEDNNWMPDMDSLEHIADEGTRLMWINYPNMPTGRAADHESLSRIVDFATRHNILLVNDNPYSFILNDDPTSIFSVEGAMDVAIELNSLSKSHNMAGWRIGMAAGKGEFIQYIIRVKSNMDSGMFKPLQLAAVRALNADGSWYNKQNTVYLERRKMVWEIFDLLGCEYKPEQTGMFVWARIPVQEESGKEYAEKILQEARVFITPGFIFGSAGNKYLRASLCQPAEVIEEAKQRIRKIMENGEW